MPCTSKLRFEPGVITVPCTALGDWVGATSRLDDAPRDTPSGCPANHGLAPPGTATVAEGATPPEKVTSSPSGASAHTLARKGKPTVAVAGGPQVTIGAFCGGLLSTNTVAGSLVAVPSLTRYVKLSSRAGSSGGNDCWRKLLSPPASQLARGTAGIDPSELTCVTLYACWFQMVRARTQLSAGAS